MDVLKQRLKFRGIQVSRNMSDQTISSTLRLTECDKASLAVALIEAVLLEIDSGRRTLAEPVRNFVCGAYYASLALIMPRTQNYGQAPLS